MKILITKRATIKIFCLLVGVGILFHHSSAQENSDKNSDEKNQGKTYTEEQFSAEVEKRVRERLSTIKRKGISEITQELLDRERKILSREKTLDEREELLKSNIVEFEGRIKDFEKKQDKIIGCLEKNKREEQVRVSRLVEVISNMKPAKAADLIAVQDTKISVKILAMLDTVKASKIFNLMDKEKSALLQKQYLNMKK